jgi:hypothetical protein
MPLSLCPRACTIRANRIAPGAPPAASSRNKAQNQTSPDAALFYTTMTCCAFTPGHRFTPAEMFFSRPFIRTHPCSSSDDPSVQQPLNPPLSLPCSSSDSQQ